MKFPDSFKYQLLKHFLVLSERPLIGFSKVIVRSVDEEKLDVPYCLEDYSRKINFSTDFHILGNFFGIDFILHFKPFR